MINFDLIEAQATEALNSDLLFLALLGASGNGKSRVTGTLPGKSLYIYTGGERHGALSNKSAGGDILPIQVDFNYDKKAPYASSNESYANLMSIIKSTDQLVKLGIKNIIVDGLTELEQMIRGMQAYKDKCKTSNGGHNTFAEGAATIDLMRPIMDELRNAQRNLKCHVVITCLLDVKSVGDKKEILEASPKLTSYGVASSLIPQFDDILVVGRMQEDDKEVEYNFQMCGNVQRTSKEVNGRVKKMINFSPRNSVINHGIEIPEYIPADLKQVLAIKKAVVKK